MSKNNKAEAKVEEVKAEDVAVEEPAIAEPEPEKEKLHRCNYVYLGPTITGVIRHAYVFKDGVLPDKVQKCVDSFPMMKKLFVPIDEMANAVKELRKQSALSTICEQVNNKFSRR